MNQKPQEVSAKAAEATLIDECPEPLLCYSCKKVAINCYQSEHGCRLCSICLTCWLRLQDTAKSCPCGETDRPSISDEFLLTWTDCLPDIAARREVNELKFRCPNSGCGCPYSSQLKHLDRHLTTDCNFEMRHCNFCNREVQLHLLNSRHKDLLSESCCEKFFAPCPHCNGSEMLNRQSFLTHLDSCQARPVECTYSKAGCGWSGCLDELEQHCKDSCHLHLRLLNIFHQQEIQKLREELAKAKRLPEEKCAHTSLPEPNDCHNATQVPLKRRSGVTYNK
ncbi:hypothetical protein BOX15_Mlig001039g1 [Macrostomum lignano]|uniref:TRAF-type domain-containing protein n=1 Tax=Macrostomum lignano TaxID=282301 RepID=A0A267GYQ2_9PLAT|nr:hypothetical protein BOX15_Mlig001039g1 [Macrostomum lignano]